MAFAIEPSGLPEPKDHHNNRSLTPSDQLLSLFVVNVILILWVWSSFALLYTPQAPTLQNWMYWLEGSIVVAAGALALYDSWWPRLRDIVRGERGEEVSRQKPAELNIHFLKVVVLVLTALNILVLWRLADSTGGVISPYAPFLTAPAIFAPFVTKNWKTILALSATVALALVFSDKTVIKDVFPGVWVYRGSALVMVILAGTLTAVQAFISSKGAPLTGHGSGNRR